MKRISLVLTLLLFSMAQLLAQRIITGKVMDTNNEPLIGASIFVQGTTIGTVTDVDGSYSLELPQGSNVLIFSYTGYSSKEVTVSTSNVIDIALEEESTLLNEVVVTAYGTTRKEALTGSVTSIKSEAIAKRPINNVTTVLEGAAPGVVTQTANGQPGSGISVRIRGFGSINATQDPLYVLDGVPYTGGTSNINPDDVESISILKDASATALYGSRAANGVVIITTKKGKR
ncbi:MAG: TonB-dependent receptor plug domain-containing protein [Haliscomenobacter sp.]|nr:TonB-dependent receptor plug domain-containing protein [Haliscomenobacter sp.]